MALECQYKSLEINRSLFGENDPSVAASYNSIGIILEAQGKHEKALEYHNKSLEIEANCGGDYLGVASSYNNMGVVYDHQGRYDKALEYYSKALEMMKSHLNENDSRFALSFLYLPHAQGSNLEKKLCLHRFFRVYLLFIREEPVRG